MLLTLNDNINNLIDYDNCDLKLTIALELIAGARRSGKHHIIASPKLLNNILEYPYLSEISRHIYKMTLNKLPILNSLKQETFLHISIGDYKRHTIFSTTQSKEIQVPVFSISDIKTLSEPILICENLEDCAYYENYAKFYASTRQILNYTINLESRGGGGNTLADEYKKIQSKNDRLCLCICDSDRILPDGKIGETAEKVKNGDDPGQTLSQYHIIKSRMIENLIPTELLDKAINGDVNKLPTIAKLQKLESSPHPDARQYIHLKKGLYLSEIVKYKTDNEKFNYFSSVYTDLFGESVTKKQTCMDSCTNTCKPCTEVLIPPLGGDILNRSLKYVNKFGNDIYKNITPKFLYDEIIEIGKLCFEWGWAPHPQSC